VEHQVDKRRERGNSLNWVRCSWEGSFHACERDFRQCRDDDTGVVGVLLLFVENCQETSERDTANKRSLELCVSIVLVF
jgi:hypothetical protein